MNFKFIRNETLPKIRVGKDKKRLYLPKKVMDHLRTKAGEKVALAEIDDSNNYAILKRDGYNEYAVTTPKNGNSYINMKSNTLKLEEGDYDFELSYVPQIEGDNQHVSPYVEIQFA